MSTELEKFLKKVESGRPLSPREAKRFDELKIEAGLAGSVNTMKAAARILGISVRALANWKKLPGFPIEPDGTYDTDKISAWRGLDPDPQPAGNTDQGAVADKVFWDVEFRRWRAKLSEVAYQRETGELIPRDEVKSLLTDRATEFKKALMGRARRLALRIANKDAKVCQTMLEEDAYQVLEIYSRPNPLLKGGSDV